MDAGGIFFFQNFLVAVFKEGRGRVCTLCSVYLGLYYYHTCRYSSRGIGPVTMEFAAPQNRTPIQTRVMIITAEKGKGIDDMFDIGAKFDASGKKPLENGNSLTALLNLKFSEKNFSIMSNPTAFRALFDKSDGKVYVMQVFPRKYYWFISFDEDTMKITPLVCTKDRVELAFKKEVVILAKEFDNDSALSTDELQELFQKHGAIRFYLDEDCYEEAIPIPAVRMDNKNSVVRRRKAAAVDVSDGSDYEEEKKAAKKNTKKKKKTESGTPNTPASGGVRVGKKKGTRSEDKKRVLRRKITRMPGESEEQYEIRVLKQQLAREISLKLAYYGMVKKLRSMLRKIELSRIENKKFVVAEALEKHMTNIYVTYAAQLKNYELAIDLLRKYVEGTATDGTRSYLRVLQMGNEGSSAHARDFLDRWEELGYKLSEGPEGTKGFFQFMERYANELPPDEAHSKHKAELKSLIGKFNVHDDLHLFEFLLKWTILCNAIFYDVTTDPKEQSPMDILRINVREILLRARFDLQWMVTDYEYDLYRRGQLTYKNAPPPPALPRFEASADVQVGEEEAVLDPPCTVPRGRHPMNKLMDLDLVGASAPLAEACLENQTPLPEFQGQGAEQLANIPKSYDYEIDGVSEMTNEDLRGVALEIFGIYAPLFSNGMFMAGDLPPPDKPRIVMRKRRRVLSTEAQSKGVPEKVLKVLQEREQAAKKTRADEDDPPPPPAAAALPVAAAAGAAPGEPGQDPPPS